MSDNRTYDRIIRYLKGLLSDRERHDLEKDMMRDPFDDDAFEGLNQLSPSEFEADMKQMMARMDQRIQPEPKVKRFLFYRIAAGFVLLLGIAAALYFLIPGNKPTEFLTQETGKEKAVAPPETSIPSVPDQAAAQKPESPQFDGKRSKEMIDHGSGDTVIRRDAIDRVPENNRNPEEENSGIDRDHPDRDVMNRVDAGDAMNRVSTMATAESAKYVSDEIALADSSYERQYITGRVLGVNRQALQGVTVTEEGSAITAMTDRNGNFRLPVKNPSSTIALKYAGYKPMEVPSREIAGKEISMNEDMPPLNEVLVTGYGQRKAKQTAGGESKPSTSETAYKYYKPVPPGGSLRAFQEWVESRIDVEKFMELLPGNYKVTVDITIGVEGTLNQVSVREGVPVEVADEYKRVVASSPAWQPAKANENPIDANIRLVFTLILE